MLFYQDLDLRGDFSALEAHDEHLAHGSAASISIIERYRWLGDGSHRSKSSHTGDSVLTGVDGLPGVNKLAISATVKQQLEISHYYRCRWDGKEKGRVQSSHGSCSETSRTNNRPAEIQARVHFDCSRSSLNLEGATLAWLTKQECRTDPL